MTARKLTAAMTAAALLAACEARIGKDGETEAAGNESVAIEGTAEEGTFSIDAPGFEMKVAIPEGLQGRAHIDSDSEIIPQGATFRGIHIQANEGRAESGVELRFTDPRPPEELAAWYRSGEGGRDFTVSSAERRGDAFVIAGETGQDKEPFTVRLEPRAGGGTAGRLAIRDVSR